VIETSARKERVGG